MSWFVNISLKSGKFVSIDDLQSVNEKLTIDGSIKKITNFSDFHLLKGQRLSFVGASQIITLISDDIEYVDFQKTN